MIDTFKSKLALKILAVKIESCCKGTVFKFFANSVVHLFQNILYQLHHEWRIHHHLHLCVNFFWKINVNQSAISLPSFLEALKKDEEIIVIRKSKEKA